MADLRLGTRQADVLRCLIGNANGAWSGGRSGFVYGDRFTTFTILEALVGRGLVEADFTSGDDYGVFTITRAGREVIPPRAHDRINVWGWQGTVIGYADEDTMMVDWDAMSAIDYPVARYAEYNGFIEGRASYEQIASAEFKQTGDAP